jgi:hypothetical protein
VQCRQCKRSFESLAWIVRLAGECALPCSVEHSRGTFVAVPMAMHLCSTLCLWNMLIYWGSLPIAFVHTYSQLKLLYKIRGSCVEYCRRRREAITLRFPLGWPMRNILLCHWLTRWLFLSSDGMDIWRIQCSFASASLSTLLHHPNFIGSY